VRVFASVKIKEDHSIEMPNDFFFKRKRGTKNNLINTNKRSPKKCIVGSFTGYSIAVEDLLQKKLLYSNVWRDQTTYIFK
jgi:hypothetical protein